MHPIKTFAVCVSEDQFFTSTKKTLCLVFIYRLSNTRLSETNFLPNVINNVLQHFFLSPSDVINAL